MTAFGLSYYKMFSFSLLVVGFLITLELPLDVGVCSGIVSCGPDHFFVWGRPIHKKKSGLVHARLA